MKFIKYLLFLSLILIHISCKKDNIVEPTTPTSNLPPITSLSPGNITNSSVLLSGQIDLHGSDTVSVYFEYGLTNSYGNSSPVQKIITSGIFTATINNLTSGTLYHWRIYCKTKDGDVKTSDSTFITLPTILPILTNLAPGNLTNSSVVLNGKIDLRGTNSALVYFEYGLTNSYGSKSQEFTIAFFLNSFNATISNLIHGTTYHWRIYCKTAEGDATSSDATFTTLSGVEFNYPLEIGKTWTYSYYLMAEFGLSGTIPPSEVRRGKRIWEVMSKNEFADSIVYNLISTGNDTVMRRVQINAPPDTSYEEQIIPFTIVVHPYDIYLHFNETLRFTGGPIVIPRFVPEGTTQIQLNNGNVLLLNGTGLIRSIVSGSGNTYARYEVLNLIE